MSLAASLAIAVGLPGGAAQAASVVVIAAMFVVAGVAHFLRPAFFQTIVPPSLPSPRTLVYLSGAAEVLGGLGMLAPILRPWAAWGLAALLVAVFPANLYMWRAGDRFRKIPRWALLVRLPLQAVLIAWVLWAGLS